MATVVLDSTNLGAVLADAAGDPPADLPVVDNASQRVAEATAEVPPAAQSADDDVEGSDGLTPRQKREYTAAMQKTIGKKHGMMKEAEEFAAAQYSEKLLAERRAEAAERELAEFRAKAQPVPAAPEQPKRENFATEEAFADALLDWKVDVRLKAKEVESAQAAASARQAQVVAEAKARIAHALEIVPDYAAVTGAVDMEVPPYVAVAMQESELFAELGYHFAQHTDELEAIRKMTPTKALLALGKIEAKLQPFAPVAKVEAKPNGDQPSLTTAPKPSPQTDPVPSRPRASTPITPLSSASSGQVVKDEATMDVREVITDWSRKNRINLNRRQRH